MADPFDAVVGQDRAVAQLRAAAAHPVHAYLLVGPPGSGKRAAAAAFAAAMLCGDRGCGDCSTCAHVLAGVHPDVVMVERTGAAILVDEAREIARLAARSPVEGDRKVLVLTDFHLVDRAAPALLKTIEEPSASTVFVILADYLPPELVTIASRCVVIEFGAVSDESVAAVLVRDGVAPDVAQRVATASNGNIARARLLVADAGFAGRQELWAAVPTRLDGHGATVAALADDLMASIEGVLEPVKVRQAAEVERLDAQAKEQGGRVRKKDLEDRHRREQRRARMDELRAGLAVLSRSYRDRLATGSDGPASAMSLDAIRKTREALLNNPNETLLLQAMLVRLSESQRQ
ncbi:MAG: DNA polymerase III subunit delta' [Actinobacteria bacterium]|nr:DNA polymerase III subunit delta' [Actinomycetota bacterium]